MIKKIYVGNESCVIDSYSVFGVNKCPGLATPEGDRTEQRPVSVEGSEGSEGSEGMGPSCL